MRECGVSLGLFLVAMMSVGCAPTEGTERVGSPSQVEDVSNQPEDTTSCLERTDAVLPSGWGWIGTSGLGSSEPACAGYHVVVPDVRHEGLELVVNAGPVGVAIPREHCENSFLSHQVWGWRAARIETRPDGARVAVEPGWEQVRGGVEKGMMIAGECHFPSYETASPTTGVGQLVLIDVRFSKLLVVLRGHDASTGELLPMTLHLHRRS